MRAQGERGTKRLRETLEQLDPSGALTRSEIERLMLALCRAHSLPQPVVNGWIQLDGIGFSPDFLWPNAKLIVETDGHTTHRTRKAFEADRRRDQLLAEAGYTTLRFTWRQLTTEPERLARTIRAVLDRAVTHTSLRGNSALERRSPETDDLPMSHSKTNNIAARAGRWSAQHRKKAIVGWLLFVILAVFIGGSVGTKTLDDVDDSGIGESGRADTAVSQNFPDKVSESVMVQNKNASVRDPEFKAVVADVQAALKDDRGVRNISSPYGKGNEGQLSKDGHSALITFELPDKDGQAEDLVEAPLATVAKLDKQHSGYTIEEFGDASADRALSKAFSDDFQRAEITSLPITLIILILAFGALLAAFVPLLLAITAVAAAIGLIGPISQIWPVDESINSVVLLIGLAVGVDYALFYIRREREERARGRSEEAALEAAAATSGVQCSCPASP